MWGIRSSAGRPQISPGELRASNIAWKYLRGCIHRARLEFHAGGPVSISVFFRVDASHTGHSRSTLEAAPVVVVAVTSCWILVGLLLCDIANYVQSSCEDTLKSKDLSVLLTSGITVRLVVYAFSQQHVRSARQCWRCAAPFTVNHSRRYWPSPPESDFVALCLRWTT